MKENFDDHAPLWRRSEIAALPLAVKLPSAVMESLRSELKAKESGRWIMVPGTMYQRDSVPG